MSCGILAEASSQHHQRSSISEATSSQYLRGWAQLGGEHFMSDRCEHFNTMTHKGVSVSKVRLRNNGRMVQGPGLFVTCMRDDAMPLTRAWHDAHGTMTLAGASAHDPFPTSARPLTLIGTHSENIFSTALSRSLRKASHPSGRSAREPALACPCHASRLPHTRRCSR